MIWPRDRSGLPFEDHYRSLLDHAYFVGHRFFSGDRHRAEEVAQETLTRAYERWESVARHPNQEAWVMNAAWKVCMEIHRRESRDRDPGPVPLVSLGEDVVAERPLLVAALSRLTRRQRTVAMARYYFGYSVAETAAALGMNESQVRTASLEAVLRLRKLLAEPAATVGGEQPASDVPLGGRSVRPA